MILSAGILLHRRGPGSTVEVLLGHMGGPFWARKDEAAWSIPKGEHGPDEAPLDAARREFAEELGSPAPPGEPIDLGTVRSGRKTIAAFALEGDLDVRTVVSNTFEIEWPPRSGRRAAFPEIDRAEWFAIETAREKIVRGQTPFLDRLVRACPPQCVTDSAQPGTDGRSRPDTFEWDRDPYHDVAR